MKLIFSEYQMCFGFGVYYSHNDFYAGFSAPKLFENKLNVSSINNNSFEERNYYMTLGGAFNLNTDQSIKLKPSLLVKMTESTLIQFDANFLFYFNDKFYAFFFFHSCWLFSFSNLSSNCISHRFRLFFWKFFNQNL